jgi:hypothetical protein
LKTKQCVFHLKRMAIVIEMDKYRLEVPFLTLNKHGTLLITSLALDVPSSLWVTCNCPLNNALNHSLTYSLIKVRWLAIIFETFQVLFVYHNRGLIIWKKVLCTMDHSFGILFQRKLKRANPFLPFGRKSLLALIIKTNICICKYIIISYT